MSGDPEKDKREEERLLRAMQKKTAGPKTSVFAKAASTDFKKQKEEEDRKKKQQEEEKARKQREDAERRKKIEEDEQQRRREAELEAQRRREAEERERAEKAAAEKASASSATSEPHAVDAATEKVLSKEEQRLRRVVSGKQETSKPKETGLQAHLRLLQEKQSKIEEEPTTHTVTSHAQPAQHQPQPVHPQHTQPQHAQPQHAQPQQKHVETAQTPAPNVSESSDFPPPGPASILGEFEFEVLKQLNTVRLNPVAYANYLRTLESNYDGNVFSVPGSRYVRQTKEGVSALHGAIAFLSAQQPVPELFLSGLLSKVSKDLVEEEGKGVQQTSQNAAYERFSRYGRWEGEMAEMISYGGISAKEVVLQWLVDDGDRERRDQRSIVQPHFRNVGLSSGHHPEYGRICVATLTHEYNDLRDPPKEAIVAAAANVSLIKEEEGKVVINGGLAPGNKSGYKLLKRGKRLTLLSADVNRSWDLPFDFQTNGVRATIDAQSNLTIQITKATESAEDAGVALISTFPLAAQAGSPTKIQLAVRQDPECIYVDINPSSYEEEVAVKTKGNSVEVESKHTEIEEVNDQTYKKVITSVQTLQLPFKPTDLVIEHKISGKPCIVINKKTASTPRSVQEEEIPIF